MFKSILFLLVSFCCIVAHAQSGPPKEYTENVQKADAFYDAKDYKSSAEYYTKAFIGGGGKAFPNDRYNAACSWAMAGNPDSAFHQLQLIVDRYDDLNHISIDGDLVSLYNDKRWKEIIARVKENKEKKEENLNKPLVAALDSIYREDQGDRMRLDEVEHQYGRDSKELKEMWKKISEKDSVNLIKVTAILDKYGWLGPDVVGYPGNQTLFLVIQHADITTQKKYLPMMREAAKQKKAQPSALALLEDRVALREGKRQIYGSQIGRYENGKYYISPLEDPENVDKRRAEVGLQPLADYISNWQLEWNVEEYKKELPAIEAREKNMSAE